jgi:CheY-like chemotaxis protein
MSLSDMNIDELKEEYLVIIDENLNELEVRIVKLEKISESELKDSIYEIFRLVHSIKGSAGSFEFYMLSSIFHRFEDHINANLKKGEISKSVDLFLKFIDLGRKCIFDYKDNSEDLEKYTTLVDDLTLTRNEHQGKILLVEPGKSIQKIFRKVAEDNNLEIAILKNGATALNRILTERFDAIISSVNIDVLDGKSFLSAIRVMQNINRKTPLLLITSDENTVLTDRTIQCFHKDNLLIQKIEDFIKKDVLGIIDQAEVTFNFKNVFCSEDDRMIQKIINKSFAQEDGVTLNMASDLATTKEVLFSLEPDLIILDFFFKDCTAEDIMDLISKDDKLKKIPIVFMTSSPDKVDLIKFKKQGNVRGILEKPFKARTLLNEIAQIALS